MSYQKYKADRIWGVAGLVVLILGLATVAAIVVRLIR